MIKINIDKKKSYNHLLRVALIKNNFYFFKKKNNPKLKFNLKLINYKRIDPEFKNLKYKIILKHLSKMDNSTSDVGLVFKKNIRKWNFKYFIYKKDKDLFTIKGYL